MAISFKFFADPGLTQPLTSLAVARTTSGGSPPTDRIVYLGSPFDDGRYISAAAVGDPINVSPVETEESGSVLPAHIALALSSAGLATATPGDALALPNTINCGAANAIAVHVRVLTPALAAGEYAQVRLQSDDVYEAGV